MKVQTRAADRMRDAAESEEGFCSDTVSMNWMPLLFDAMLGPGANPDVKRMAL